MKTHNCVLPLTVHKPDVTAPITANGKNEEQVSKIELTDEEVDESFENLRSMNYTELQLSYPPSAPPFQFVLLF